MKLRNAKTSFFVVTLGVAFEHLDMMLMSLLASSIVKEFVKSPTPGMELIYAYIGYAIAFIVRPLGAFAFGCIGDLYGRKISLLSSMLVMTTATLSLSILPSVQSLGVIATILFFICRILQGLAIGGEYGTAMTYAFEFNKKLRTFYGACVIASTHIGGLIASLLACKYIENFRLAFLIGGLIGVFLLFLRSYMQEYYIPTAKNIASITKESTKNTKAIRDALLVASMLVLVFYGSLVYLNELIHIKLGISRSQIFKANALLLSLWIILTPCFGFAADKLKISYHKIMRCGALGVFLTAPILGLTLVFQSYPMILIAQIILHIFHMLFCICTPKFFGNLFKGQARNTAIATSYSLGASFTAALAPLICHLNIQLFNSDFAICLPFMLVALLVFFTINKEDVCKKPMLLNSMI